MPLCAAGISSNSGLPEPAMSCQSHSRPKAAAGDKPFRIILERPVTMSRSYYQLDTASEITTEARRTRRSPASLRVLRASVVKLLFRLLGAPPVTNALGGLQIGLT